MNDVDRKIIELSGQINLATIDLKEDSIEEALDIVEEAYAAGRTNLWEDDFIENVAQEWQVNGKLTKGQTSKLMELKAKFE